MIPSELVFTSVTVPILYFEDVPMDWSKNTHRDPTFNLSGPAAFY